LQSKAGLSAARQLDTLTGSNQGGVSESNPVDGAGVRLDVVVGILVLVALIASLMPAYRAAGLDPVKVLRAE
jgi:hypothetical protein